MSDWDKLVFLWYDIEELLRKMLQKAPTVIGCFIIIAFFAIFAPTIGILIIVDKYADYDNDSWAQNGWFLFAFIGEIAWIIFWLGRLISIIPSSCRA